MLRLARILRPARRDRPWLLHCDRCNACSPPVSTPAARELDQTECFVCEHDPDVVQYVAQMVARAWADVN